MNTFSFRRAVGLALALLLMLSVVPAAALAAQTQDSDFTLIELVATDVTLDETVFEYTGSEIKPNVTVRVKGQLLTLGKDYTLSYADNVEPGTAKVMVTGIATASETVGYTGTVEHPFYINEKAPAFTMVEIKGTDVTIEGTEFAYTGQPIEPKVTVNAGGKTLVNGTDYAVEYVNNLVPGTGTVIVRGIATASETMGYIGEVRIDFTIRPMTSEEYPLTEIKAGDVTINGKQFPYTGKAIEPEITVTVDGKVLKRGTDYALRYVNNIEVGSASAIVTGLATATEFGGYTGEVEVKFTITPAETTPETKPETPPTTEPEAPSESEPAKKEYKVTKGDKATWYQGSTGALSFTADGAYRDFTGVSINGKTVDKKHYDVKDGTVVLLKTDYLKQLKTGSHTITIHFADGDAAGTFRVAADQENPKTGDSIALFGSILVLSAAGLCTAVALRKKFVK